MVDQEHLAVLLKGVHIWNWQKEAWANVQIDLSSAQLEAVNLNGAYLQEANLSNVNFSKANLGSANFINFW